MKSLPAVLLVFGGCAQLAGIDDTSGDGLVGVSLAVERVSIGATIERAPQSLAGNTATYLIPDAAAPGGFARIAATEIEPGVWAADIFDGTPPVLFDLPEDPAFPRLWNIPARDLLASLDVLEHPNPTPLADPTTAMLTVNATLDTAVTTETFELFVVGTWTRIALPTPAAGALTLAPPPFAVSDMTPLTNRPLETITTQDAVLILRRLGASLDGVLEVTPFDQGTTDTLTGTLATVALDRTLDVRVDPADAETRLSAARPGVANLTFGWELRAAPGRDLGNTNGPLLGSGAVVMGDTMATASYANPFEATRGWGTALTYAVNATRTTTPPGQALPVTLSARLSQTIADPTPAFVLDFPAGRVEAIALDGRSLSTDGMMVSAPTAPVTVEITTDRDDDTLYFLDVMELIPNEGGTELVRRRVLQVVSLEKSFTLPSDVFVVGSYYTLRATTLRGLYPDIATGDLRTRALPVATGALDSGVFQVMP